MTSKYNVVYTFVCSNEYKDFYVSKLRSGWYTFAVIKGQNPRLSEGRTLAGFTSKRSAVQCANKWAICMK